MKHEKWKMSTGYIRHFSAIVRSTSHPIRHNPRAGAAGPDIALPIKIAFMSVALGVCGGGPNRWLEQVMGTELLNKVIEMMIEQRWMNRLNRLKQIETDWNRLKQIDQRIEQMKKQWSGNVPTP